MVLGYLLLGWVGGAAAAAMHLTTFDGSLLGAFGAFSGTAMLIVLICGCVTAIRSELAERRRQTHALRAPVEPLQPRNGRRHA